MKLVHKNIDKQFIFKDKVIHLIVENADEYYFLTNQFYQQCELNEEGDWILSDNHIIDISKYVLFIYDYFNINFNSKKFQSLVNGEVKKVANNLDLIRDLVEINTMLASFNFKIKENLDFPVEFDDNFTIDDLIKFSKYSISDEEGLVEKLITYIEICSKINGTKLVVFANLSMFLDKNNLGILIKQLRYLNLPIFMIDGQNSTTIENEDRTIIDVDLCVI